MDYHESCKATLGDIKNKNVLGMSRLGPVQVNLIFMI